MFDNVALMEEAMSVLKSLRMALVSLFNEFTLDSHSSISLCVTWNVKIRISAFNHAHKNSRLKLQGEKDCDLFMRRKVVLPKPGHLGWEDFPDSVFNSSGLSNYYKLVHFSRKLKIRFMLISWTYRVINWQGSFTTRTWQKHKRSSRRSSRSSAMELTGKLKESWCSVNFATVWVNEADNMKRTVYKGHKLINNFISSPYCPRWGMGPQ